MFFIIHNILDFPDILVQVLLFCVVRAELVVKQINICTMTAQGTDG